MSGSNQNSTVLIITSDVELLSSLLEDNTTGYDFMSRESIQVALDESDLLINNDIVIIDIDSINGGTAATIEQTLKLKKNDPTQVIMMVGDPEPLGDLLKSNIQPLIFRAFNKPIHPNQIFLAFGSASKLHQSLIEKQAAGEDLLTVGPIENKTNIDNLAAQQKSKPAIYIGIGLLVLGLSVWLLLGNKSDPIQQTQSPLITSSTPTSSTPTEVETSLVTTNDDVNKINKLNQEAAKALLDGRQVSPKDNNALFYYDQVLIIDPFDLTAYEGKKNLVAGLKNSYANLITNAEFDKAFDALTALQKIEPLDTGNSQLRQDLETAITEHVDTIKNTGTAEQIDQTTALLAKISSQSESSRLAIEAMRQEKVLIEDIDQALADNNLIPPTAGNAYSIVSEVLQKNTISKVNFAPRISSLSEKLLASANSAFANDDLEQAEKFAALVKRLNVDPQNLTVLENRIKDRKTALAAEAIEAAETPAELAADETAIPEQGEIDDPLENQLIEEQDPKVAKIVPPKVIDRESPRYPKKALEREIEGWVSVGFVIDTQGMPTDITVIDSEPNNTFDSAAISAVKRWRFSPARNEDTQEAVDYPIAETKLQFKISN